MATVNDLYNQTKMLMFEKPSSTIYDNYLIGNLNRLLMELFEENNVLRIFKNKDRLEMPQQVTSRNEELLYEDEIVLNVLPLGLSARFFIDDDLQKFAIFNTDYNNARVFNQKLVSRGKLNATSTNTTI